MCSTLGCKKCRGSHSAANTRPERSTGRRVCAFRVQLSFLLVALLFLSPLCSDAVASTVRGPGHSVAPSDSIDLPTTREGLRLILTVPHLVSTSPSSSPDFSPVRRASPSPSEDRWLGRDKAKHLTVSALWTLSTQYVLVSRTDWDDPDALPASVASAATVGLSKEFYDASGLTGHFCGRDLVADAVGIALAVGVITL